MLEFIVRPFQNSPIISNRRAVVTTVKKSAQKVQIVFGAVGQDPTVTSLTLIIKPDKNEYKEKERKTTDVRATNPDDKSQFIIQQRIDSISFTKKAPNDPSQGSNNSGTSGGVTDPSTALKSPPPVDPNTTNPTVNSGPAVAQLDKPDEVHHFTLDQPADPPPNVA